MTYDAGRTRHELGLHHYAKGSNGSAIASNWIASTDGTTAVLWRPESAGGSVSYASNSNEVSFANAAGASSLVSRADHVHRGVTSLAHSSNTYTGPVTLETEGSLYIVRSAANTYRLGATGGAAGGGSGTLTTVKDEGTNLSTAVVSLNFVGAGVTATGTTAVTVTIPGGGTRAFGLDRASFDGTYGDDFDGASLNARWTRHNQTSGEETYQVGGLASALQVAHGTSNAAEYIYQTDPNNTNQTWETSFSWKQTTATGQMFGIICVNTSGNGVGTFLYDNAIGFYLANIASHTYSSALASDAWSQSGAASTFQNVFRVWHKLRKASGVYFASYSLDGQVYSPEISGTPAAFTPARIGVGRFLGTNASTVYWHWFDKTA